MITPARLFTRFARNALFRRPPGAGIPVEPEDYGLTLAPGVCRDRARGVFESFFRGVDTGVRGRTPAPDTVGVEPLYQPFFHEGAAMGRSAARVMTLRGHLSLARGTFSTEEPYAILRVIGAGFLVSFLPRRSKTALARVATRFGNHGPLVHDGFGFGTGLFRWRGSVAETARSLDALADFERYSAFNGVGRSLWFRFMDRPAEAVRAVADHARADALLGGLGLASVFTFPDELTRGYGVADSLSGDDRRFFLKGVRIALFVRHRDQAEYLAECFESSPPPVADRAHADLAIALSAHETTRHDPRYIELFHEACAV